MLRNIDPILSPEILYALRAMGHGDTLVIADANFPGEGLGPDCLRADGSTAGEILRAVLSVMPLDGFVSDPALSMQVVGDADATPDVVSEFQAIINAVADTPAQIKSLERFAFYAKAETAFAVIQTGERRHYGNIILQKGVLVP